MNERPLNILYILPQLPYPPDRGGKIVLYHLVKGMLERHRVQVAALVHHREEQEAAEAFRQACPGLVTFPAAPRWSVPRLAKALYSPIPYKVWRFHHPGMMRWVQDWIRRHPVDVIHCQNFYTAQYITGEEASGRILYQENFETLLMERYVESALHRSPLLRLVAEAQVRRTLKYEVDICRRFDRVLMISEEDRCRLAEHHPQATLDVLPPGIDLEYYQPTGAAPVASRVVFTGSMNYFPNVDAVNYFYSEIWQRIRRAVPNAEFFIVGQRPEKEILRLQGVEGITVTGRVEDIRPPVAEAAVYVVPLRIGGGVRLKILEALAMGKAVVSTPVGAEGLDVRHGENILLADDAGQFADAVIRLLKHPEERIRLETKARHYAQQRGDWSRITRRLEEIYREVGEKRGV